MLITVDCGTTNMRCRLYDGKTVLGDVRRKAGVRNTAFSGTNEFLRTSLHDCIEELLTTCKVKDTDVEAVLCSGTLSSNVGIHLIPHVVCPAGVNETARAAELVHMPEITSIPLLFIPGVKVLPAPDEKDEETHILLLDSMSGEECEIYGIMNLLGLTGDFYITLPGSYNKAMEVDKDGRIISMITGMCGEFIAAMSEHTLLRCSLPDPVIQKILPDRIVEGYDFAKKHGVSPTLIKARMVQTLWDWTPDDAANFFVGAILLDDIRNTAAIVKDDRPLVVGGGNPLRTVFEILLRHEGVKNLIVLDDETARFAPNVGAKMVWEKKKNAK